MKRTWLFVFLTFLTMNMTKSEVKSNESQATFGGGCYWCVETIFEQLKGVHEVVSGFSGGEVVNPSYKEVCTGLTGHAEVIRITFDPGVISFQELLTVFFSVHDPTTLNRQGADVGTQYRSVVFYHNPQQKEETEAMIDELQAQGVFDAPIVTEVSPLINFFQAENYHQDYYNNNPNQPYCRMVINPKVDKFKKAFKEKLKNR